jgi:tRNA1(Val) A37 N6-methylase TrmN6
MPADASGRTVNAVLGGRLRLEQPGRGHRVGHDAILLAAACPARPRERVVDLGAGVGAAGLALAVRVAGADVTLVEIDVGLAALAAANARRNGLDARVIVLDAAAPARSFAAVGLGPDSVARVLMNPPFNDPARQRSSPDPHRRLAHAGSAGMLAAWVKTAARLLRPRGTLTLIWRADGLADILRALDPAFGAVAVLPVHGKPGQPAIRVLVRATKASGAPLALLPGLILNDAAGRPTTEAETVLRAGRPLPLGEA